MTLAEFKRTLRAERLDQGLLQTTVARRTGVGLASIRFWETTSRVPYDDQLRDWAAVLGLHVPAGVTGRRRATCGTAGGYTRHRRRDERPCRACLDDLSARRSARAPRGEQE